MVWAATAVAGLGILGTAGWLVFGPEDDPVRERRYRAESACLFTGDQGLRGPAAVPVWAGMQRASAQTRVQVTYLAAIGAPTAQNAATYLGGLLQQQCDLLIAVDEAPVTAVTAVAAKYPKQRFVVVGGAATAANVAVVDGAEGAVYALLTDQFEE
ncbi:Basic membrane protein [Actinoplanes derwentensis]|uniref:Basic membrane protein n=2 Tax=Actinoplanes derwentensis TaxID=113562 RepID=A0A1H1YQC3_9ACTN|nr:hypothetical protein Ade03nite_01680 [Actinoplanes derwentensis]SDT23658.1 Basic membrane protein [Actinoplanes derwentensis]